MGLATGVYRDTTLTSLSRLTARPPQHPRDPEHYAYLAPSWSPGHGHKVPTHDVEVKKADAKRHARVRVRLTVASQMFPFAGRRSAGSLLLPDARAFPELCILKLITLYFSQRRADRLECLEQVVLYCIKLPSVR
jgi:hypothetical protein